MQLVPFNAAWADAGGKTDLYAIYHRGETICALPIRRHHDWQRKGFSYVTLATRQDVVAVRAELSLMGVNLQALDDAYERTSVGAFRVDRYLDEQPAREAEEKAILETRLAALTEKTEKGKKAKA